jgi:hypothetical protein
MSNRRAVKPINPEASKQANDTLYANHPELIQNGQRVPIDPTERSQQGLRDEWLNSYAANGGKVAPITGAEAKKTAAKTKTSFSTQPPDAVETPCPNTKKPKKSPPPVQRKPVAKAAGSTVATPATKTATPTGTAPAIVCKLISSSVQCSHGRKPGKQGILMVVPDSTASLGDKITGTIQMNGGCGKHPEWSVDGYWTSKGKGSSFNFNALKFTGPNSFFGLKDVSPHNYNIHIAACGGTSPDDYKISVYPPGKVSFKLNVQELKKRLKSYLDDLPIPPSEVKKIDTNLLVGSFSYSAGWKEDKKSWKALYEMQVAASFDPLFKIFYKGPIYPLTLVPGWLSKWVKAGFFIEVWGAIGSAVAVTGQYDPVDDKTRYSETKASASGTIGGAISLELKLVSADVAEAAVSGETSLTAELSGAYAERFEINWVGKWDGIKGKATIKALWGIVEYSREFQIMAERELWNDRLFPE